MSERIVTLSDVVDFQCCVFPPLVKVQYVKVDVIHLDVPVCK